MGGLPKMKIFKEDRQMKKCLMMCLPLILIGCAPATYHKQQVQDNTEDRVTVGKVQREIKVGMSSAQVIEILGSPNVVSTDEERREVWVYDKVATEVVYSEGGVTRLREWAGAASQSQRTLTIVIKFDKENKVRDFAYHTS